MATVQEYLDYTKKWVREYGPKTLVLMQVGSFFESYSLRKEDGTIYGIDSPYGSNIEEFASINDMTIANKSSFLEQKQVVMAGVGVESFVELGGKVLGPMISRTLVDKGADMNVTSVVGMADIEALLAGL